MRPILTTAVLALGALAAVATAQPMRGRGMGAGGPALRMYDPKTVETVQGTVRSVDVVKCEGMPDGIHLTLATGTTTLAVHVGPAWYVEHQDLAFAPGDKVTIRGSRITYQGKPALIAARVTRGDDVMVLRNEQGFPQWMAWRRRASS